MRYQTGATVAKVGEVDKAGGKGGALFDAGLGGLWSRQGETSLGRLERPSAGDEST